MTATAASTLPPIVESLAASARLDDRFAASLGRDGRSLASLAGDEAALRHVLLLVLTACGGTTSTGSASGDTETSEPAASETSPGPSPTATAEEESDFPRTFVHDPSLAGDEYYGHLPSEVVIGERPERIVSLAPGEYTDGLLALGIEPVGSATYADVSGRSVTDPEAWPPAIADEAVEAEIFSIGSCCEFDVELIASLEPDLIIGTTYDANGDANLAELAPLVEPFAGRDWRDTFRQQAFALGSAARAEQVIADWETRVTDLRDRFAGSSVAIVRPRPDSLYVYGPPSNAGTILSEVGLDLLPAPESSSITDDAPGAIGDISLERIGEMAEAEHLFVITYNVDDEQLAGYTSNALWQDLPAVQAGNVHLVEGTAWTNHGPLGADLVLDELEAGLSGAGDLRDDS